MPKRTWVILAVLALALLLVGCEKSSDTSPCPGGCTARVGTLR